ncbi:MAG: TolC family protein, partial [Verrucomicrobia bacterium]|nr:TolC family protein [Verrucomicrobiota bacterium]
MRLRLIFPVVLCVGLALSAQEKAATNATIRAVTLTDVIQMAVERNLDIQIQRFTPDLSLNDLRVALGGYDPNFTFGYTHNYSKVGGSLDANKNPTPASISDTDSFNTGFTGIVPIETGMSYNLFGNVSETYGKTGAGQFDSSSGRIGLSVTQPLLRNFLTDTTRLNVSVARNRLKYSEWQLKFQIITVATAVETAYYDLIFNRESVKVQEKALELAERLLADNKKRVEVGALAPLDEKQAESQVAARRSDLLSAQRSLDAAQNALRRLVGDDYATLHDVYFEPTDALTPVVQFFDVQESWHKGLEQRPEVRQARLDLERNGIQLKYYRNQVYPQLDITGSYGFGASGGKTVEFSDAFDNFRQGNRPFWSAGAIFSIPLGNTAARARRDSGKLSVDQALLVLKKLEQDVMVSIDDAIKTAKSNFERIDSTRQARLYAEAALDAEEKKLANGKSTSFVVLQLQRDLTSARSEEIRALADYNKSLAALSQ